MNSFLTGSPPVSVKPPENRFSRRPRILEGSFGRPERLSRNAPHEGRASESTLHEIPEVVARLRKLLTDHCNSGMCWSCLGSRCWRLPEDGSTGEGDRATRTVVQALAALESRIGPPIKASRGAVSSEGLPLHRWLPRLPLVMLTGICFVQYCAYEQPGRLQPRPSSDAIVELIAPERLGERPHQTRRLPPIFAAVHPGRRDA